MSAKGSEASSITQVAAISRAVTPGPEKENICGPFPAKVDTDTEKDAIAKIARDRDLEKQQLPTRAALADEDEDEAKLTLADVNPAKPIMYILRRMNNLTILIASGMFVCAALQYVCISWRARSVGPLYSDLNLTLLDPQRLGLIFGLSYCIAYTCSRTLANQYGYNALDVGLVLLSFGVGKPRFPIFSCVVAHWLRSCRVSWRKRLWRTLFRSCLQEAQGPKWWY